MPDLQQPTDVSEATPINRILAQAAAAAFANRRDEAHELLQQAIRQAPSSPEVWLACAALAGDPVERLAYLERACALNPTDTRARTLAGRARVQVINQLTEQGIAAVRDKNMGAARRTLRRDRAGSTRPTRSPGCVSPRWPSPPRSRSR